MPKHVCRNGSSHKTPQLSLTREALRLFIKKGSVCISGDLITTTQRTTTHSNVSLWRELATDSVYLSDVAKNRGLTKKQTVAFRQWLRTNGYCSNGRGVFTKTGCVTQ